KAARSKGIPIFLSDVERLGDGALGALGYDYTSSGVQAARLVDRVLKGENPRDIPLERYSKLSVGINLIVARQLQINIPPDVLDRATILYGGDRPVAPASAEQKRLALFVFSNQSAMEECVTGVMQELQESGILESNHIKVDQKNAQNEFHLAQSIAQDIARQNYDYLITLSTPALQVTAQANKKIPHVFGCVSDPYRMGVAENEQSHLANVTGVASMNPIAETFVIMRQVLPEAKRVGIVWNPAEACSEACTMLARQVAPQYGFELLEVAVSRTGDVLDAVNSLISKGIDVFLTSGDNTVNMAVSTIGELLKRRRIPYFTNEPNDIGCGSLVSIGADYTEVGRETAKVAIRVINGEAPQQIPILDFRPNKIHLNEVLAREYGIVFPADLVNQAAKIAR
ncbi:MAG: ABC transporter substrate binding protein, partial [Desulforhabdus sp.]|nr:ABC transporter substrate binding protein [Desulforhabdus sp.]